VLTLPFGRPIKPVRRVHAFWVEQVAPGLLS
jgi:hypothetical protein